MIGKRLRYWLLALLTVVLCATASGWTATLASDPPDPAILMEESRQLYESGQYQRAADRLRQTLQDPQIQADPLRRAAILSNLSLIHQSLGQWDEATQTIEESLSLLNNQSQPKLLAQVLDIQGRLQYSTGQPETALTTWQQSAALYAQQDDRLGETRSRLNQSQALQALGLYRRSLNLLLDLTTSLQAEPDSRVKGAALRSLGEALQRVGSLEESQKALEQSLTIAQALPAPEEAALVQFSLANTFRSLAARLRSSIEFEDQERAETLTQKTLDLYQQVANTAPTPLLQAQALLNRFSLLIELERISTATALIPQIADPLDRLPANHASIYARINFAQNQVKLRELGAAINPRSVTDGLTIAARQSKQLGDQRAESYALGILGEQYETAGQWAEARQLTERALVLAQTINATDIIYRWQWQLGRLLRAQGNIPGAINAYDAAVANLKSIRGDLVAVNPEVQFSFREGVEPVYRESVALLLQSETDLSEATLDKARQRIESLQLAELDNFFREACLDSRAVPLDRVVDQDNPTAAIVYPIVLPDEIQVIVKIPGKPLQHYPIPVPQTKVQELSEDLLSALVQFDNEKPLAETLYGWLVKPYADQLTGVNTLVFVLDGPLRNVPMAVLYDGQTFLVEKYAIALSLGLQLLDPRPLQRGQLQVLAAGLIQPPPGFELTPLPAIQQELESIAATVPETRKLREEEFTRPALAQQMGTLPFTVVHLATHGRFSSRSQDTYILAADGPITVNQFDELLRRREELRTVPIELLVLSACETAAGDDRATLGLAGVAVRAGARSTLASLWQIDDRATADFVGEFYRQLVDPTITKAEALRRAQLSVLKTPRYQEPGYWAPYILVGNWL